MQGITSKILGTDIVQYEMDASKALEIGLLTDGANGCKWFAEWATKTPTEKVWVYTFGGIFGGFTFGEVADFQTLAEFADGANDSARQIWMELQNAWDDFLFA